MAENRANTMPRAYLSGSCSGPARPAAKKDTVAKAISRPVRISLLRDDIAPPGH
jgi:hypothetical protein